MSDTSFGSSCFNSTSFDYSSGQFTIRDDLAQAHAQYWRELAQPGNAWSGVERVAIAQEVRNAHSCEFCAARKNALSPYTFEGQHQHSGALPERAVDAVHRIVTDQNRITQAWIDDNIANGLSESQYVELLGVTVTVLSIDELHRALDIPPEPLPGPGPGEPDGYRPSQAVRTTGFVAMIPANANLEGRDASLWKKGRSANVIRALSLVPDAVRQWGAVAAAQYLPENKLVQFGAPTGRSINRMQIEIVAGRVSAINECFY